MILPVFLAEIVVGLHRSLDKNYLILASSWNILYIALLVADTFPDPSGLPLHSLFRNLHQSQHQGLPWNLHRLMDFLQPLSLPVLLGTACSLLQAMTSLLLY